MALYESTSGATFKGIAADAALRAEQVELSEERDIRCQVAKCFAGGDELVNRFQFVEDHKDAYGVKRLCEVGEIARSSFSARLAAAPGRAARAAADAVLAERIRRVQDLG